MTQPRIHFIQFYTRLSSGRFAGAADLGPEIPHGQHQPQIVLMPQTRPLDLVRGRHLGRFPMLNSVAIKTFVGIACMERRMFRRHMVKHVN